MPGFVWDRFARSEAVSLADWLTRRCDCKRRLVGEQPAFAAFDHERRFA